MNAYELKQADRKSRMAAAAERLRATAAAEYRKADLREEVSGIPFGQPILVGHHSEGRHRRTIERADNAMRRAIDATEKAAELEHRANSESTAISSDDPDAADKLRQKIADAEALQEKMRAANKAIRKNDRATLETVLGFSVSRIDRLFVPDFAGRMGFPDYELTNNNANIKRMKLRLAELERPRVAAPPRFVAGVEIVEDIDENRLRLFFPTRPPPEVRDELKARGFRWSPTAGAWQRMLNNGARFAAEYALRKMPVAEEA